MSRDRGELLHKRALGTPSSKRCWRDVNFNQETLTSFPRASPRAIAEYLSSTED